MQPQGRSMKKEAGFTLLELLMVVIIIGILATMAMPAYFKTTERTRASEALSILGTIRGAELRYKAQDPNNKYTTSLDALDTSVPGSTGQPLSSIWTYSISGTDAGANAIATRKGSTTYTGTVEIDLDSGATCGAAVYGFSSTSC